MKKIVFVTGVTGNIGAKLVLDLLHDISVDKVIVLVRAESNDKAKMRVDNTFKKISPKFRWKDIQGKLKIFKGDVTACQLGLTMEQYSYLQNRCHYIIHGAAATNFDNSLTYARKVNLYGTINLMQLAVKAYRNGRLKRFGYISTAFVNGRMNKTIFEDKLQENPIFDNTYEQSKYETEKYVRSQMKRLPVCVFRPSIVVGDSISGHTVKFNVLYTPIRMVCSGRFEIIPGSPNILLNVVPVDYVSTAVQDIMFGNGNVDSKTFNLVSNNHQNMTVREIIEYAIKFSYDNNFLFKKLKIRFIPRHFMDIINFIIPNKLRRLKKIIDLYIPYTRKTNIFDNTNTSKLLLLNPPPLKNYLGNLLTTCFLNNWGKIANKAA